MAETPSFWPNSVWLKSRLERKSEIGVAHCGLLPRRTAFLLFFIPRIPKQCTLPYTKVKPEPHWTAYHLRIVYIGNLVYHHGVSLATARRSLTLLPNQTYATARNEMARAKPVNRSGETIRNSLLLDLSSDERSAVLARMEIVELPVRTILSEAGEPIEFAYFINGGCASILNVMSDGKCVEVGLVGKEGFVGSPLLAGFRTSPTRVIIQVAGSGFRIGADDLHTALDEFPRLLASLERYTQELNIQAMQTAACNRLHEVEHRLARWLLMTQDRAGDSFELTQEFVAHMLGTRRATVTITAGLLQKAGVITYKRGRVQIKNRAGLELEACECYSAIQRHIAAWRKDRRDSEPE